MTTSPNDPAPTAPRYPMSVYEARQVHWPFDSKEPMGVLLDRGELPESKLRWAAQKAHRPDVQRAAATLLLALNDQSRRGQSPMQPYQTAHQTRAAQPMYQGRPTQAVQPSPTASTHYGPRVLTGSNYLEDQESLHWGILAFYLGVCVGVVAIAATPVVRLFQGQDVLINSIVLIITALVGVYMAYQIRQQLRTFRQYRAGRLGEAAVLEQIRTGLDSRWTIYRNVKLPNKQGDIDLILVGPGGVWTVQVKSIRANVRIHDGRWQYQRRGTWIDVEEKRNPSKQVSSHARQLYDFFGRSGIKRWVERAVALAEAQPIDRMAGSEIPIWMPYNVHEHLARLSTRYPPNNEELTAINALLTKVVEQQIAVEQRKKKR